MGGGKKQKLGTAKVTFRVFLGKETGLDLGRGRGVREYEKMAKKRDLLSLQAKNILTQDREGASLAARLTAGNTNRALWKLPHPLYLEALFHARGPRPDNGRAQPPGGFCKPVRRGIRSPGLLSPCLAAN